MSYAGVGFNSVVLILVLLLGVINVCLFVVALLCYVGVCFG